MLFRFRLHAPLLLLASSLTLAGCAIHQNQQGGYVFNMDLPEVFGVVMDKKPMPDGTSEVSLRKMGNHWSLKFGLFSRVVELPQVTGGKILQVNQVGDATNIVLQTSSAQCATEFMLVSLTGAQASVWPLKVPCGYVAPVIQTGKFEQFLDFVVGQRVTRFIYRAGKLMRNPDVVLSPGMQLPGPIGEEGSSARQVQRRPYYPQQLPFKPSAWQIQQRPAPAASQPTPTTQPAPKPTPKPKPTPPAPAPRPTHTWSEGSVEEPTIHIDLGTP